MVEIGQHEGPSTGTTLSFQQGAHIAYARTEQDEHLRHLVRVAAAEAGPSRIHHRNSAYLGKRSHSLTHRLREPPQTSSLLSRTSTTILPLGYDDGFPSPAGISASSGWASRCAEGAQSPRQDLLG